MALNIKKSGLLLATACLATSVQAADIRWSGFGTFGVGQTLNGDGVTYNANEIVLNRGDLDDYLTFDALSIVGLQSNINLDHGLSATIQLKAVASQSWNTDVAWAYISYDLTPTLKAQAGRKLLPIYAYTDSIDVSYTYHWIRPPSDVYAVPVIRYDGVNLMYQDFFGDWELSANGLFGRIRDDDQIFDVSSEDNPTSYRVWGGYAEATLDWMTFRLAGIKYENLYVDNVETLPGQTLSAFAAEYYGASVKLNPGNWLIMAEYTWYELGVEDILGDGSNSKPLNDLDAAWYITAAYTMGKWTPHLTYSQREQKDQGSTLAPFDEGLARVEEENTTIVGVRYDFHPSSSLKMEYHLRNDNSTVLGEDSPMRGSDKIDVIQLAIDFIF